MKSDCCGADLFLRRPGIKVCSDCKTESVHTAKLTPEQMKAIRWPDAADIFAFFIYLTNKEPDWEPCDHLKETVEWAIRYALKDLIPEKEK